MASSHLSAPGAWPPQPEAPDTRGPQREIVPAEDDPWKQSCILTLDGGGVRGYASLCILKNLMDVVQEVERAHAEPHESSFCPDPQPITSTSTMPSDHDPLENGQAARVNTETNAESNALGLLSKSWTSKSQAKATKEDELAEMSPPYEGYLPCHYFDFIAGTSTGGLNAIMLGRLRMPVEDCLSQYPQMAEAVFYRQKRSVARRLLTLSEIKYDSTPLEDQIMTMVQQRSKSGVRPLQTGFDYDKFHSPEDLCKTMVFANQHDGFAEWPYIFRSYPHHPTQSDVRNPGPAHQHEIWKVARATSAAPTMFDPIEIDGNMYSDGALGTNNPVRLALQEVAFKTKMSKWNEAFGLVLSLGTGQKPTGKIRAADKTVRVADKALRVKGRFPRVSSWPVVRKGLHLIHTLKENALNVDRPHVAIKELFDQIDFKHYYRWTGGEEVGSLKEDKWRPRAKRNKPATAQFIEDEVRRFMSQDRVRAEVQACAEELVRRRRARVAHMPQHGRWRRNTHCTLFRCPTYCDELLETRQAVKAHIISQHPDKLDHGINLDTQVAKLNPSYPHFDGGPF